MLALWSSLLGFPRIMSRYELVTDNAELHSLLGCLLHINFISDFSNPTE